MTNSLAQFGQGSLSFTKGDWYIYCKADIPKADRGYLIAFSLYLRVRFCQLSVAHQKNEGFLAYLTETETVSVAEPAFTV